MVSIRLTPQEMAKMLMSATKEGGWEKVCSRQRGSPRELDSLTKSSPSEALSIHVSALQPNELMSAKTQGPLQVGQTITTRPH